LDVPLFSTVIVKVAVPPSVRITEVLSAETAISLVAAPPPVVADPPPLVVVLELVQAPAEHPLEQDVLVQLPVDAHVIFVVPEHAVTAVA